MLLDEPLSPELVLVLPPEHRRQVLEALPLRDGEADHALWATHAAIAPSLAASRCDGSPTRAGWRALLLGALVYFLVEVLRSVPYYVAALLVVGFAAMLLALVR